MQSQGLFTFLEAEIAYKIYCLLKVLLKEKAPEIPQQFCVATITSLRCWNPAQQFLSPFVDQVLREGHQNCHRMRMLCASWQGKDALECWGYREWADWARQPESPFEDRALPGSLFFENRSFLTPHWHIGTEDGLTGQTSPKTLPSGEATWLIRLT